MNDSSYPETAEFTLTDESFAMLFWLGDLMPGGFFIYRADESQEILYVNRATLEILGCETCSQFAELTDFRFRNMVHPDDYETVQASIERQIAEQTNKQLDYVKYRVRRLDGEIRWITDYGRLAHIAGYGDVYVVFITDDTERRYAQEEQHRMELALAQERQRNEIKSNFLFNMSHDIRTPMNAIIGFSELARRHQREPERLSEYLDKAVASGQQMLSLIDDMLELNRLEDGALELHNEPGNLAEQINLALDPFRILAAEKQLALTVQADLPPRKVLIDQERFRRILCNLLDNAVKFTPPGGSIRVTAQQKTASDSGFVRYAFTVADTGIGMSEGFLAHMYNSFEREASSTVSGVTGTGLGLTIVKALLDRMGGSISAVSRKGEGSAFTFELPLRLAEAAPSPAAPLPDAGAPVGSERLLIVEDIEMNREIAETLLEEAGFLVESVVDGCDAVEAVKNHEPGYYDLILMDIQMPVMNGYEATRAIRALPREDTARLPIFALSANSREEDIRASIECGMDRHVAKPFDIDELTQLIRDRIALDRREAAKADTNP